MKKITIIALLSLAVISTGCKKKYEEGFNAGLGDGREQGRVDGYDTGFADGNAAGHTRGYNEGYASGNASGYADGYSEGQAYFENAGYDEGHADGMDHGATEGYRDGYEVGYDRGYDEQYVVGYNEGKPIGEVDGYNAGYNSGYNSGSQDGYDDGYDRGWDERYDDGYSSGYSSAGNAGYSSGYDSGYSNGYSDGYSDGESDYEDDYESSYGSSAKSNNPAVKLAAMVNQDLVDYSKLKKFNASSQGSLVFSHADGGTVDMEKLASLKEQHFLNEMSSQIQARFGLSQTRAKEIAVVAHQFNKNAGMRELTQKDAEVFAKEVIGADLNSINEAVSKSLKGESSDLDKMLVNIADHNQTSPENVNRIIMELFF